MAYKKAVGTDFVAESYPKTIKKKRIKNSRKPGWILRVSPAMVLIALIFITGIGFVAQHVWLNYLGFQINGIKKEIVQIQTNNEKLKLKIANMGSLDKIEKIAVNELAMVHPDAKEVHYIFSEDIPAAPEDVTVHMAGLVSFGEKNETHRVVRVEKSLTQQAWLGTIQDFFSHLLVGDSKS